LIDVLLTKVCKVVLRSNARLKCA